MPTFIKRRRALIVYPCALMNRTTMVLQSVYGTEIKTKEVLNVVDSRSQIGIPNVW